MTPMTERHRASVRYGGGKPIVMKGPVTGSTYRFSGSERVQLVDPRDAVVMARERLFRIEGIVEMPLSPGENLHG